MLWCVYEVSSPVFMLGMILLVHMDPRVHTPMYYFLSNLSFCDFCSSFTMSQGAGWFLI
jgi:hypothetical protein